MDPVWCPHAEARRALAARRPMHPALLARMFCFGRIAIGVGCPTFATMHVQLYRVNYRHS